MRSYERMANFFTFQKKLFHVDKKGGTLILSRTATPMNPQGQITNKIFVYDEGDNISHTHNYTVQKRQKLDYKVQKRLEPSFETFLFFEPIAILHPHWRVEKQKITKLVFTVECLFNGLLWRLSYS